MIILLNFSKQVKDYLHSENIKSKKLKFLLSYFVRDKNIHAYINKYICTKSKSNLNGNVFNHA